MWSAIGRATSNMGAEEQRAPDPVRTDDGDTLTSDAFDCYVAAELGIPRADISPNAHLIVDLGFDSLRMLELVLVLDGLGARLDAEDLHRAGRMSDLYRLYVERRTLARY